MKKAKTAKNSKDSAHLTPLQSTVLHFRLVLMTAITGKDV